ncbi:MAG: hypothetical protein QW385_08750 [Thermoproteota archaeon]
MSSEEERKPVIESYMSYILLDEAGREVETGECKGVVDEEHLTLSPKFGGGLPFYLRDIVEIEVENYKITLPMESREKIILFNLGYDFEDFLRVLTRMRNEVMVKDLLMNEAIRKKDVETEFNYYDENGGEKIKGTGEIRLYETGLVVMPTKGEMFRIPYSSILKVSEENYEVRFNTELGEQLILSKMGSEYEPFVKTLSNALKNLQDKAVSSIKAMFPTIDTVSLRRIANLMKDGKAVKKADIEAINPKIWLEMEKKIASNGLNESYVFLKGLARQEKIAIGFKRGLMGGLIGEYVWFLIPIYDSKEKKYGNAIAMEAAGEEGGGKATYFFRIMSRKDYPSCTSLEELDREVDQVIMRINQCMLDINFRREPIYLPDDELDDQAYIKYRVAVRKIPSLKLLRSLYIGRIAHFSPEQWKNDVMDLLRFNMETLEDSVKWKA